MKMIGLLVLAVGFIPAMVTAATTDSYLTFMDYFSVLCGFVVGVGIAELRYEH